MKTTPLLCIALALGACSGDEPASSPSEAPPPAVQVSPVEMTPMQTQLAATGLLVPREEAAVGSELSGYRVLRVLVDEGETVRAGQALATLDGALLAGQIAQARAEMSRVSIAAERARSEAARVTGLDGTGVIADESIAQRRFEARTAGAQVQIASAQVDDLERRASRLTLRAPVGGIVLQRGLRPGDVAGASAEHYFRIARGSLVELDAEVPEAELGRVSRGQVAMVTLANGRTLTGTVRLVGARVDPQTKLARVRIALPGDPALKVGGFARASFGVAAAPVATLPERAIQYSSDGPFVSVVGAGDRIRRVPVRTGGRAAGRVELRAGPPPGTRVLVGGGALLLAGDKVRPILNRAGR